MATDAFRTSRRTLLAMSAGAAVVAGTRAGALPHAEHRAELFSAARVNGVDGGAFWRLDGVSDFALPARAHAPLSLPDGNLMLVGRRPGRYAAILARDGASSARLIAPVANHRFSGHAAVHGDLLVTSELHEETSEALVTLRDPHSGASRQAWHLPGLEPHDCLFADGGGILVVALGGIARPADVKAPPLNLGHLESAILELDARDGRILCRHALPRDLHSLSLRHMALAPDGRTLVFGMQDQDRTRVRPLIGVFRLGRGVELLPPPKDDAGHLRFYIGSVAIDASGRYAAATSPKGGCLGVWSLTGGDYVGGVNLADVCGLAADSEPGCFWASSGFGDIQRLRVNEGGVVTDAHWKSGARFDNHLLRL